MNNFTVDNFRSAFHTRDIEEFLALIFPPTWKSIAARIIETGATFSNEPTKWAPRWTQISPTVRGKSIVDQLENPIRSVDRLTTMHVKSCIYRAHDCIHQLWGLPIPNDFSEEEFYGYKRAQMCGEVAVLTLTEFLLCNHIYESSDPTIRKIILGRNAIPMLHGPLAGKGILQIASRLDGLLHKKIKPHWVRGDVNALRFVDDYVPMLEHDRREIDKNWALMKKLKWKPLGAPFTRYSSDLDGLELTQWMIQDFLHLMDTDDKIDVALTEFNKDRRSKIVLPELWSK